ncbi:MAG: ATP-dependent DNA helicase RecG, partial [Bacteroidales bacterium]|nr:ATP-dependent DNA helicase RecG [Bacteroidales bacterium]
MLRNKLDTEVQYLPGVGPKRAALLRSELEVATVGDLLHVYPFRYVDRSSIQRIADVRSENAYVQILGTVVSSEMPQGKGNKRLTVNVQDSSGAMELVFFKGIKYTYERLKPGGTFLFFGKPSIFNGRINMVHPEIDNPPSEGAVNYSGTLTGVYNSTDKLRNAGISARVMNKLMAEAIDLAIGDVRETLPEYILKEKGLVPLRYAIRNIHFPTDETALAKAQYRLKWEELFLLQLSLLKQKYVRSRSEAGIPMPKVGEAFNKCYQALPYELTGAQKRVIKEIRSDLMSGHQMNRLLQGDVGSGKTMVAVLTALIAIGNGYQTCIMAPTEVLARQH